MTSLRRLVESVIITGFDGTTAPDWLLRRLDGGLGGVCWFGQNISDAVQARQLSDHLHGVRDGVLVMSDEEGGDVTRLEASVGSSWPGHATLGALDDVSATRAVAAGMGAQLRAAGVDVALSPDVDVNSTLDNPVIGVRSFGATAELVARHGVAFVDGIQSAGVAACAKHFPGHGSTVTDSHLDLPRVDDPESVLRERDLAPFAAVIDAGVRCVMTAHVVFPAFDDRPATLSPILLGMLRDELGFDGVVITDALDMRAIACGVGRGEGAVRTLRAGADLVCVGNPSFPEAYDAEARLDEIVAAVTSAVDEGRLTTGRLEEASARVGSLTRWLREQEPADQPTAQRALGRHVAGRALQRRGDVVLRGGSPVVLDLAGGINLAAGHRDRHLGDVVRQRDPGARVVDAGTPDGLSAALAATDGRPVMVLARQPRGSWTQEAVSQVLAARPDAVVVYTGLAADDAPGERVVWTRGGGRVVAEALADLMLAQETP